MITLETCLIVSQLCCSILAYDPPGTRYDLSDERKQFACSISNEIESAANRWGLEPELLTALIIVESRFNPRAVSRANACGLTQVIPKWTGGRASRRIRYTCNQLKDPETSLEAGASILSWWINFRGSTTRGLCGYNAGYRGCRAARRYATAVENLRDHLKHVGRM